jgi:hypothetical protein
LERQLVSDVLRVSETVASQLRVIEPLLRRIAVEEMTGEDRAGLALAADSLLQRAALIDDMMPRVRVQLGLPRGPQ